MCVCRRACGAEFQWNIKLGKIVNEKFCFAYMPHKPKQKEERNKNSTIYGGKLNSNTYAHVLRRPANKYFTNFIFGSQTRTHESQ